MPWQCGLHAYAKEHGKDGTQWGEAAAMGDIFLSAGGSIHHVVKSQVAWSAHRDPISPLFWKAYKLFS